jgi:hypothetical protein
LIAYVPSYASVVAVTGIKLGKKLLGVQPSGFPLVQFSNDPLGICDWIVDTLYKNRNIRGSKRLIIRIGIDGYHPKERRYFENIPEGENKSKGDRSNKFSTNLEAV